MKKIGQTHALRLLLAISLVLLPAAVTAQSPLERLEQQIRQRNPQPAADDSDGKAGHTKPPPAANPAASSLTPADEDAMTAEPAFLGLVADDKDDRGRGARIVSVHANGPAAKVGLRVQDLIVSMAGIRVRQISDVADILSTFTAGETAAIDILRDGKKQTVNVTFGRRPANLAPRPASPPRPAPPLPSPLLSGSKEQPEVVPLPPGERADDESDESAGPALTMPPPAALPEDPLQRIERLERRVEALERRIAELEKALAEANNDRK